MADPPRNELFVPKREAQTRHVCPKCQGDKFSGRNIQGTIRFTCPCGNVWEGGLGQATAPDPRVPVPPEKYVPTVQFNKNPKTDEIVEERRPVNLTQEFRKGLPEPEPGEE